MSRRIAKTCTILALAALLACCPAMAASLQVAPTSVELQASENGEAVWLSNTDPDKPVRAQVRLFRWTQKDGEETLEPTRDLAISPPLVELAPGARQLVRVIRTGPPPVDDESTYRIIVDEVPDGEDGAGQAMLPLDQTSSPVDLDLINNIMRLPYRTRLALLINEFGTALAGRGGELNEVIHRANPALRETDEVLKILAEQNRTLAQLAVNGDESLGPLARERARVGNFIVKANETAQAGYYKLGLDNGTFWGNMTATVDVWTDLVNGIWKSAAFGGVIALIATFQGYTTAPTSEGVAYATTRTVVSSSIVVLALDFVMTAFLM